MNYVEQGGQLRIADSREAIGRSAIDGREFRPFCMICDDLGMTARTGPCSCPLGAMYETWLRNLGWTPRFELPSPRAWWRQWWPF